MVLAEDSILFREQSIVDVVRGLSAQKLAEPAVQFLQSGSAVALSYPELLAQSAKYANLYTACGVESGQIVLIVLRHSPELLYSFLGAIMAGAVPSFIPPLTSKQDPQRYWTSHRMLAKRIEIGFVLTSRTEATQVPEYLPDLTLKIIEAENAREFGTSYVSEACSSEDIAFLQHSSGTTGLKKGVALTHGSVLRQVRSYSKAINLTSSDRIISWLPLYHDMGLVACFILPLLTGVPVVMIDPFEWVINPVLMFSAIKAYQGTLCWMPNFAFHHLCRTVRVTPEMDLSSMRAWIDCSEPCRSETFELFTQKFGRAGVKTEQLQVCYAMAETVFAVTQTEINRPVAILEPKAEFGTRKVLSAGRSIAGISLSIRNEDGTSAPDGQVGEITVSGDCLFSGYYKLEEETGKKLRNGLYHTGDLGFVIKGELYVTGRKNDLIIVHGRNYYAHDLEFLINQVPGVYPGRVVAAGWFRPDVGSEDVVIIAESSSEVKSEQDQLKHTIKQVLLDTSGLLPFDVLLVAPGWLVKTTSGKLSRVDNLEKYLKTLSITAI